MNDWATKEAILILSLVRGWTGPRKNQKWLAAKLRVIHQKGVCEGIDVCDGIERLGKALTPEQASQ